MANKTRYSGKKRKSYGNLAKANEAKKRKREAQIHQNTCEELQLPSASTSSGSEIIEVKNECDETLRVERDENTIVDPAIKINEPSQVEDQPESLDNEVSIENGGSSQGPCDTIFDIEGTESVMDTLQNKQISDEIGCSSQEQSIETFEDVKYVMIPQREEITINIDSDESLGEPKKKQPCHSQPTKGKKEATLEHKIALRDKKIATLVLKIATQSKQMENQDKKIATQDKLIAKQEKTIESLKGQIGQLEIKNDKLMKRNEFLRGSVQRLRDKILTDSESQP